MTAARPKRGKSDLLLKINGLRKTSKLPWDQLADIYEAESGEKVDPGKLRVRVKSCVYKHRQRQRMLAHALDQLGKIERLDAVDNDASDDGSPVERSAGRSHGGVIKRFLAWIKGLFRRDAAPELSWMYGNFNGSGAKEDTSKVYGYRLTKFSFDGKTVRFDGVGAMWGYDHTHHDARNCLFFKDSKSGGKYVGGFFEWGDPSRKSREIKNISSRYGGWDPDRLAKATEFAFCITDKSGRRRSNVVTLSR